jgi:serine protease Do
MKKEVWKTCVAIGLVSLFVLVGVKLLQPTRAVGETETDWMKEALAVQDAFVRASETTAQAVVTISAGGRVAIEDPWVRFWYGGSSAEVRGLGSGVVFDKRGYVITNDHVVEVLSEKVWVPTDQGRAALTVGKVASDIKVTLPDGRSFDADIQGRDRLLDIAVLKMKGAEGEDFPVAALGDSSKVRVGQLALAIGNPYGGYQYLDSPQPTVTQGIISALNRTFPSDDERRSYGGLIQTSAAINRGNSGGPLVNIRGEVIGINAAIFSTSQGSEGIGFAIPINRVKARLSKLIAGEQIEYGYLGIGPGEIDPLRVKRLGLNIPRGVVIKQIEPGEPAAKAGLKEGDIIVELDDKGIVNSAQLIDILANTPVGTVMRITVVRDGKRITKSATIGGQTKTYVPWPWD